MKTEDEKRVDRAERLNQWDVWLTWMLPGGLNPYYMWA